MDALMLARLIVALTVAAMVAIAAFRSFRGEREWLALCLVFGLGAGVAVSAQTP